MATANNAQDINTPEDLHELQYARHILEELLGWPAKGNIEIVGDCIRSVSKAKRLTLPRAHGYIARAIKLHVEQGGTIDKFWFMNGDYMRVRPCMRTLTAEQSFRPCKECEGGWVKVEREGILGKFSALKRCSCFLEWVKKVKT